MSRKIKKAKVIVDKKLRLIGARKFVCVSKTHHV